MTTTPEQFEKICNDFKPSPRRQPGYDFGRFARSWDQERKAPPDYDATEWFRGWDDRDKELKEIEPITQEQLDRILARTSLEWVMENPSWACKTIGWLLDEIHRLREEISMFNLP